LPRQKYAAEDEKPRAHGWTSERFHNWVELPLQA
jgi:hypothetical protein